jgi:integrase
MSRTTLNVALGRLNAELPRLSPHDIRSTARSHLSRLGVNIIVAERCLNHTLSGLVAVYDRHDYMEERRRALELWANALAEAEAGRSSNVTALRAAAQASP